VSPSFIFLVLVVALSANSRAFAEAAPATRPVLRVVADPNNLPFSNDKGEGFENKIAELIARDLGGRVEYTWWAQRRGYIRNTIRHGDSDVVIGVPQDLDALLTTRPYYRSSYVFVSRADRNLNIQSFDDASLRHLKVGVQLVGEDGANSPPAHALGKRGIVDSVVGYSVYGDYRQPNPPSRIIDAVASGEVDVAVVWGPLAGYFAQSQPAPLRITPVKEQQDGAFPLAFNMSVGVRRGNKPLRDRIDQVLVARQQEIARILDDYHVPPAPAPAARSSQARPEQIGRRE
jgi:mxaJ protein